MKEGDIVRVKNKFLDKYTPYYHGRIFEIISVESGRKKTKINRMQVKDSNNNTFWVSGNEFETV